MRLGLEGLFVGRRRELTLLDAQFDEVQAGHPRVVHIEGLAGIGKTALVERFLSQCSDAQLVRASGEESEVLLAYGVIDQLFHAAGPAHLQRPGQSR
jgi:AAA ATPase-like protein